MHTTTQRPLCWGLGRWAPLIGALRNTETRDGASKVPIALGGTGVEQLIELLRSRHEAKDSGRDRRSAGRGGAERSSPVYSKYNHVLLSYQSTNQFLISESTIRSFSAGTVI